MMVVLATGCSGDIARWTGRSEGTISLNAGMTRAEVQRRSTIALNQYGDSGRLFDFVLDGETLRFRGCMMYAVTSTDNGRITAFSFASANQSWPETLRDARRIDELLLKRGWRHDPRTRTVASLPTNPRDAAGRITDSGAIDAFWYYKGDRGLTLTVSGLWGGIPWYRSANGAKVFWRAMDIGLTDGEEMAAIRERAESK